MAKGVFFSGVVGSARDLDLIYTLLSSLIGKSCGVSYFELGASEMSSIPETAPLSVGRKANVIEVTFTRSPFTLFIDIGDVVTITRGHISVERLPIGKRVTVLFVN